ncbi:LOW QUALITY PROTEIN: checkpoint protein HUS1-like [Anableps anableps]
MRPVQPTLSSLGRVVTHDVPVDVIPRRLWQEFQEPSVPDFDVRSFWIQNWDHPFSPSVHPSSQVSVDLPPLKTMKSVVDRMKNLSNFLRIRVSPPRPEVIEANLNREMNLKIQTHLVSVTTHFKDLGSPPWGDVSSQDGGPSPSRDPEVMAGVTVDIRKLQQFLMGQQVNRKAMCNMVHQNVVHLVLLHEDVSLQYFIPAVAEILCR